MTHTRPNNLTPSPLCPPTPLTRGVSDNRHLGMPLSRNIEGQGRAQEDTKVPAAVVYAVHQHTYLVAHACMHVFNLGSEWYYKWHFLPLPAHDSPRHVPTATAAKTYIYIYIHSWYERTRQHASLPREGFSRRRMKSREQAGVLVMEWLD